MYWCFAQDLLFKRANKKLKIAKGILGSTIINDYFQCLFEMQPSETTFPDYLQ